MDGHAVTSRRVLYESLSFVTLLPFLFYPPDCTPCTEANVAPVLFARAAEWHGRPVAPFPPSNRPTATPGRRTATRVSRWMLCSPCFRAFTGDAAAGAGGACCTALRGPRAFAAAAGLMIATILLLARRGSTMRAHRLCTLL